MSRQEAYKIVVNDLINCGSPVMMGHYDARNGNQHFMYGILTLMEYMSMQVDDDTYDFVTAEFIKNMVESERKVK